MLVLSRKSGQRIMIGDSIELVVIEVRGNRVQIGFTAPPEVVIHREEVHRRINGQIAESADGTSTAAGIGEQTQVPGIEICRPRRPPEAELHGTREESRWLPKRDDVAISDRRRMPMS